MHPTYSNKLRESKANESRTRFPESKPGKVNQSLLRQATGMISFFHTPGYAERKKKIGRKEIKRAS
jgi:hypothetical protein